MPPRPILKSLPEPDLSSCPFPFSTSAGLPDSPHVHFPPTPTLTSTVTTHSPFIYDRAPIVVGPNVCALPARGERDYSVNGTIQLSLELGVVRPIDPNRPRKVKDGYFHPRAYEAVGPEWNGGSLPPSPSSAVAAAFNLNNSATHEQNVHKLIPRTSSQPSLSSTNGPAGSRNDVDLGSTYHTGYYPSHHRHPHGTTSDLDLEDLSYHHSGYHDRTGSRLHNGTRHVVVPDHEGLDIRGSSSDHVGYCGSATTSPQRSSPRRSSSRHPRSPPGTMMASSSDSPLPESTCASTTTPLGSGAHGESGTVASGDQHASTATKKRKSRFRLSGCGKITHKRTTSGASDSTFYDDPSLDECLGGF